MSHRNVGRRTQHLVLALHERHRLVLDLLNGTALTARLRVSLHRVPELVRDAKKVHDNATRLLTEDTVHPCDSLHEVVACQRLVQVHGVEGRAVEAGQPHVADNNQPKVVLRVLETAGQSLAPALGPCVLRHTWAFRCRPGHDDLDETGVVFVCVPLGPQRHDLIVEVHTDGTAHAHRHGLAFDNLPALLEVLDDLFRGQLHALPCAD